MAKQKEPKTFKIKVKKVTIGGFEHYYCPVENDYFNLYWKKCMHLRENHPDFVILEIALNDLSWYAA